MSLSSITQIFLIKVIETSGRSRDFSLLDGIKNPYVFADNTGMPDGAKLPLRMLGFIY